MLAIALTFGAFSAAPASVSVFAREDERLLIGTDSRVISSCLDAIEDDFNHATVDWNVKGASAEAVTELGFAPYSVYEGSRSLLLTTEDGSAKNEITLTKKAAQLPSGFELKYFSLTVWASESVGTLDVSASVSSGGKTATSLQSTSARGWTTLFFPFDNVKMSASSTLKLTLKASNDGSHTILLDLFGASSSEDAPKNARYMSRLITPSGCVLAENNGIYTASFSDFGQWIEFDSLLTNDVSGGTGIRLTLNNGTSCRSVTLYYTTLSNPEYSERLSVTRDLPTGAKEVSVTFPIPDSYIGKFRIVFDGYTAGNAEILSVSPALCYSPASSVGRITECTVGRDKRTVSVKGTLPSSEATKYADCPIYLYELELWEETAQISPSRAAIGETRLSGDGFSFSLPLSESQDEIYKKYAVMAYFEGALIRIGAPISVTNPEALASRSTEFSFDSKKGLYPVSDLNVLDGIAHTALEVRLDEILTLGGDSVIDHRAGSYSYTFSAEYIKTLDEKIKYYENLGVNVTVILRAGYSSDASLGEIINNPLASGGDAPSLNTASAEGINALRAIAGFLASRYSCKGGVASNVSGYTVGVGINNAAENYNMGSVTLQRLAKEYSSALRTVYTAVRSVSPEASVYMPLSGAWDRSMAPSQRASFDAKTVLEAVSACISEGGNIGWELSYDLCSVGGTYSQEGEISEHTYKLDISNIEVLTEFMKRSELLYGGAQRNIILLETEPHDSADKNDMIRLSADYVCSYLKLGQRQFSHIKAFIPAHPVNYGDTLKYIDSTSFNEKCAYARELVGSELYSSLASAYSVQNRVISENRLLSEIPSAVKGKAELFGFDHGTAGWRPLVGCASVSGGTSLEDKNGLLNIMLKESEGGYRGIDNILDRPIDLSSVEYIGFDIQSAVLPEGIDSLDISVVFHSERSCLISSGSISAGQWSTVVADTSGFSGMGQCDRISILVKGTDGADIGDPTLLLGSISAMSTKHSGNALDSAIHQNTDKENEPAVSIIAVISAAAVLCLAVTLETVRLTRKKKENDTQD